MADENVQNPQTENEEMTAEQLDEQHRVRLEKLAALKAAGKDPYTITKFPVTITNKEIRDLVGRKTRRVGNQIVGLHVG